MFESLLKLKLGGLERFFLKRNHRFVVHEEEVEIMKEDSGDSYDSTGKSKSEDRMIKHLAHASRQSSDGN